MSKPTTYPPADRCFSTHAAPRNLPERRSALYPIMRRVSPAADDGWSSRVRQRRRPQAARPSTAAFSRYSGITASGAALEQDQQPRHPLPAESNASPDCGSTRDARDSCGMDELQKPGAGPDTARPRLMKIVHLSSELGGAARARSVTRATTPGVCSPVRGVDRQAPSGCTVGARRRTRVHAKDGMSSRSRWVSAGGRPVVSNDIR